MRVLHLNWTDTGGGAARGMYSLHSGLRSLGVDSQVLVRDKQTDDEHVVGPANAGVKMLNRIRSTLESLPVRWRCRGRAPQFQSNWLPDLWLASIRSLEPDLVHVHWIGNATVSLETLSRLGIPVVWTVRDLWPITGGCFYPGTCDRFQDSCGRCPLLHSSRQHDLSHWNLERKARFWSSTRIVPVALSRWVKDMVESSRVFCGQPVSCIPNGLDTAEFRPFSSPQRRQAVRRRLGIGPEEKVLLFGAVGGAADPRKGFDLLRLALTKLARLKQTRLLVFGGAEKLSDVGSVRVQSVGPVDYGQPLAELYAASDICLVPSRYETFGKTAMEALACGTPVVCFDTSGLRDIVDHRVNGYLAQCFDPDDLAHGIELTAGASRELKMQSAARAKALRDFDILSVARQYESLYRHCLTPS